MVFITDAPKTELKMKKQEGQRMAYAHRMQSKFALSSQTALNLKCHGQMYEGKKLTERERERERGGLGRGSEI